MELTRRSFTKGLVGLPLLPVTGSAAMSAPVPTPSIIRGSISGSSWPGVTRGPDMPQDVRETNLESLQSALNAAIQTGKFFELEPGLYQIEGSSGLVVRPTSWFVWRGSKAAHIQQFARNAPVITVGDTAGGEYLEQMDLSGLRVSYSSDQLDCPLSSAVKIGLMRNSTISQLAVFADYAPSGPRIRSYRGIELRNASHEFGFFSNTMRDVMVGGSVRHLLDIGLVGTGSVFENVYLTQGVGGHPAPIEGAPLVISAEADLYGSIFEQLNIEWCLSERCMDLRNCRGTTFMSVHLEGNILHSENSALIRLTQSQVKIIGMNVLDLHLPEAEKDRAIFELAGVTSLSVDTLSLAWSDKNEVDGDLLLWTSRNEQAVPQQSITVADLSIRDIDDTTSTHFKFDRNLRDDCVPALSYVERFHGDPLVSTTSGARSRLTMPAPITTVYGCYFDAIFEFPAALGADKSVRLSDKVSSRGSGAVLPPRVGALVTLVRAAGAADGHDLSVVNHDGMVLASNLTAGDVKQFRFDGKDWKLAFNSSSD